MAAALPVDHLGDIEDEIGCSICTDRFVDARFLSCFHSFCHDCLVEMNETERVTCPLCRQQTTLPDNGVAGLRKNVLANLMAETVKRSGSSKAVQTNPLCKTQGHQQDSPNKNVSFFCETCELAMCGDCGMRDHRDQELHKVVSIEQALKRMKDKLVSLLNWGKEEEKRRNNAKAEEEIKRKAVRERFTVLKREVQECVTQEMKNTKRLGKDIQKELADIEISIGKALEKSNGLERDRSLSDLNHLTEDIINNANVEALLEMHQVIFKDYGLQQVRRSAANQLQVLSDFAENIRFEKDKREFPTFSQTFGRLSSNGKWMVLQSRFEPETVPACLCAVSKEEVAITFHGKKGISTYNKECQRSPKKVHEHVVESAEVRSMASSPSRDPLMILDQSNAVTESTNRGLQLVVQLDECDGIPLAIHTDAKGNVLVLYKDSSSLYSPNGSLMQTLPIRVPSLQDESAQVSFQPSENLLVDGANLCFLVCDERAVHVCQLDMTRASDGLVWDIKLPDDFPGARRFGELDSEGNVFIAYAYGNLVSIRKYRAMDHFRSHEVVVDGLQVMVATSEVIYLAAASPDVLFMGTPQKLTMFRRETIDDFLQNYDLV